MGSDVLLLIVFHLRKQKKKIFRLVYVITALRYPNSMCLQDIV